MSQTPEPILTRRCFRGCWIAALVAVTGCDSLVHQSVTIDPPTSVEFVPIKEAPGQNRYEWPLQGNGYVVTKPPPMAYLTSFTERFVIDETIDAPVVPWDDLELSDAAKAFLEEVYTPLEQTFTPSLLIPPAEFVGAQGFDLSADGTRLVVIKGDELVLYDVAAGKRLGAMDLPGDWTRSPAKAVRFCGETKDFLVASEKRICRISGKNGKVLRQIDGVGEDIADLAVSRTDTLMVILTESKKVWFGNPSLEQSALVDLKQENITDVDVSDDGRMLLVGAQGVGPRRYIIDQGRVVGDFVEPVANMEGATEVTGGNTTHGWFKGSFMSFFGQRKSPETGELETKIGSTYMLWRPRLACPFVLAGNQNSFLIAGQRVINDTPEWILFDVGPTSRAFSVPVPLDEEPRRLLTSRDGKVVALLSESGIRAAKRIPWLTADRAFRWDRGYTVINSDPLEQVERIYEAIGRQKQFAAGVGPSGLQTIILSCAGYRWNYLESLGDKASEEDRATLAKLVDWHKKGSVLAKTVNAFRNHRLAWDARGDGMANTVTQQGWDTFETKNQLALDELTPLVEKETRPPMLALETLLKVRLDQEGDLSAVDSLVRRAVSLYPDNSAAAATILFKLLPQWHGEPGDIISFIRAHADLYDDRYGDLVYLNLLGAIDNYAQSPSTLNWQSVDIQRLKRAIGYAEELNWPIWERHLRMGGQIRRYEGAESTETIVRHLISDYGLYQETEVGNEFMDSTVIELIDQIFEDAIKKSAR